MIPALTIIVACYVAVRMVHLIAQELRRPETGHTASPLLVIAAGVVILVTAWQTAEVLYLASESTRSVEELGRLMNP